MQLLDSHSQWPPDRWGQLFEYFRQLRISELIIQWTLLGETPFFTSSDSSATPPLERILDICDQNGIKVYIGLASDPDYWGKIQQNPTALKRYLQNARLQSESVSSQLLPAARKHSSFAGWYITEEIDDVNWVTPDARQDIFAFLKALCAQLHKLTPSAKVALSGFSNGNLDPKALEKFWQGLLKESGVDVVLFQDGIGAGKLTMDTVAFYLDAIQKATAAQSRELQIVVENFHQLGDKPFVAVPARLDRIKQQIAVASRYSSKIVAFSVPEYMTPLAGQDAERLFKSYLASISTSP